MTLIPGIVWEKWIFPRYPKMSSNFADLLLITSSAQCVRRDNSWSLQSESCDPFGRLINYYSIIPKIFNRFGFYQESTVILGYLFGISFLLIYCLFFSFEIEVSKRNTLVLTLFLASPPMVLLVERGNSDILMFILVISGFMMRNKANGIMSVLLFSISLLIKPYSFVLIIYLYFSYKFRAMHILLFISASIFVYSLVQKDLSIMYGRTFQILDLSFGARQIFLISQLIFDNEFIPPKIQSVYVIMVSVLSLFTAKLYGQKITKLYANCKKRDLLTFSSVLFVGIFTMGNSYDTRLWVILPFIAWLLENRYWRAAIFISTGLHLSFLAHPWDLLLDLYLYAIVSFMGAHLILIGYSKTKRIMESSKSRIKSFRNYLD